MPANLPPPYKAAEQRFREAKTTEDKIAALQEMMAIIPKHKGTDKLRADLRRRLSKLRTEQQQPSRKGHKGPSYPPEVADYPFTTRLPLPAMMPYQDIYLELIDLPPLSPDHTETWLPEIIRNADAALLVVDLAADDCVDMFMFVRTTLASKGIRLSPVHDPKETELARNVKPTLIIANKLDEPSADENLEVLKEVVGGEFEILPVCAVMGKGIPEMKKRLYEFLDVVRIYSKVPGRKVDEKKPFIVPRGSTVIDVARKIHREFGDHLKFARVWGSGKFDGQIVQRDHVVEDGDVLEIHVDM